MTADHTQTLWIILQSKQKHLLAKISELKMLGKFKMQEFKVSYGKSTWGGWKFKTSNLDSRTFSFHDGEVALKHGDFYQLFRKLGFHTYFWIFLLTLISLAFVLMWPLESTTPKTKLVQVNPIQTTKKVQTKILTKPNVTVAKTRQPIETVTTQTRPKVSVRSKNKIDPVAHQQFLSGRRDFQYGNFNRSYKTLRGVLGSMSLEDQKAAKRMISDMQYTQCQQFAQTHENRKATIFCEKAIATAENPEALQFLNDQEKKAQNTYLEGYTIQDVDPAQAQEKFLQVLQTARTKSTWRNKAAYQIQKYKKNKI